MTPEHLRHALGALDAPLPGIEEPAALLRAIERLADRDPARRDLAARVHDVHGLATAGEGLPTTVAGVRREVLVRWDAWTSTWDGPHLETGLPARVRALSASAARDPVSRRALHREGRALQTVFDDLAVVVDDGRWPGLRLLLPGTALGASAEPDERARPAVLTRMLATGLADLLRWEQARQGLPLLADREWIDTPRGLRVVCLSPEAPGDAAPHLRHLARRLGAWWGPDEHDGPVGAVLAGLIALTPHSVADATARLVAALADDLAASYHHLHRAARAIAHQDRAARLHALLARLHAVAPPPHTDGPIGVDLEGRTTRVISDGATVRWGPSGALVDVLDDAGAPLPREARRLLRANAAAPPNPRLVGHTGGDLASVDRLCRWLAAALQLRTLRMLLDASFTPPQAR